MRQERLRHMDGDLHQHSATRPERSDAPSGFTPGPAANALPQILELTQAIPLRDKRAALVRGDTISLEAGAVARLSTPCAHGQLAAGRAAAATGTTFAILNASEMFRAALADLGLPPAFTQWID